MWGCGQGSSSGSQTAGNATLDQIQRDAQRAKRNADRADAMRRTLQAEVDRNRPASATDAPATGEAAPRASVAGSGRYLNASAQNSFAALASRLVGDEGVAVSVPGVAQPVQQLGALSGGAAWSTSKVPVAMAAITAGVANAGDLTRAITQSDNAAAESLWSALGGGSKAAAAATAQLRAAGDGGTQIQGTRLRPGYTAFGQTDWAISNQASFVAGMSCTPAGARILTLMGQTVSGQRWGLGSLGGQADIKGGWGPGVSPGQADGWLDRQMGLINVEGRYAAVALITNAPDHGTGTRNLTELARWVAANLNSSRLPTSNRC